MAECLHLRAEDVRRVPWKNGRGVTEELALWPHDASFERGDFDARISLSSVNEPGPFSPFPGFDRLLIVTRGAGLRLAHGGDVPPEDVARLRPHAFQGEWPTRAELPYGPVDDFNVIVRRGSKLVDVETLLLAHAAELGAVPLAIGKPAGPSPASGDALVHLPEGQALFHVTGWRWPILFGPRESLLVRGVVPGDVLSVIPASEADAATGAVVLVRLADA